MPPRPTSHSFELWAPAAQHSVELDLDGARHPMRPDPDRPGWWRTTAPARAGASRYGYRLDDDPTLLPDPRAARLPDGPESPAQLVDHDAFRWTAPAPGAPLPGSVLYELHIGTFTPEGTFDAAAARLPHLVELGVDTVSLMPVCPWPGTHGWGYDGVAPWAVHEPYGGPDGLKRFVDAAHGHRLRVSLDVVHNHLGPSGNLLPRFGPYFTDTHHTPWGSAVNLDAPGSDEVRAYLIGSALAWLRDYRIDGLRLDAVHALVDTRALHFLEELAAAVDGLAAATGRRLHLIAESDLNDPRHTTPRHDGGLGLTAQWSDDLHHCLHAALTGESQGYYADFAAAPLTGLAKTLRGGWFHDGSWSSFRQRHHGRPLDPRRTPGHRLLGYLQTHDQIGNRAQGDRLAAGLSPGLLAAGAALVLTSPFTPMLFMGEEWGARTPWQYFTDHQDPGLADAVRNGRRAEFAAHGWKPEEVPDPQQPATFLGSKLDWTEPAREPHTSLLAWYRTLLALRRAHPALADPDLTGGHVEFDESERWLVLHRGDCRTAVNLSPVPRTVPLGGTFADVLAAYGTPVPHRDALTLPPASAAVVRTAQ